MTTIYRKKKHGADAVQPDPVLRLPCVQRFIRLCAEGCQMRFHERNGGNLTYWLSGEEAAYLPPKREPRQWRCLEAAVGGLGGEFFLVTASGSYMRNIPFYPKRDLCIIQLNDEGSAYSVVWGLEQGGRPTSELESHLLNFSIKAAERGPSCRVMYHAHPESVIALSYLLPPEPGAYTRALWTSMTECPFIFPEGVGVVPWMIPGGAGIGRLTAALMKKHNAVVWVHHGLFCCGQSFDEAFGLMETIEKAARIYLLILSTGCQRVSTIDDAALLKIAEACGAVNREYILPEK